MEMSGTCDVNLCVSFLIYYIQVFEKGESFSNIENFSLRPYTTDYVFITC